MGCFDMTFLIASIINPHPISVKVVISTQVYNRIVMYDNFNEMFNLSTVFLFQFLGECQVESPKGTDVVKDAIRKRKVKSIIFTLCVC